LSLLREMAGAMERMAQRQEDLYGVVSMLTEVVQGQSLNMAFDRGVINDFINSTDMPHDCDMAGVKLDVAASNGNYMYKKGDRGRHTLAARYAIDKIPKVAKADLDAAIARQHGGVAKQAEEVARRTVEAIGGDLKEKLMAHVKEATNLVAQSQSKAQKVHMDIEAAEVMILGDISEAKGALERSSTALTMTTEQSKRTVDIAQGKANVVIKKIENAKTEILDDISAEIKAAKDSVRDELRDEVQTKLSQLDDSVSSAVEDYTAKAKAAIDDMQDVLPEMAKVQESVGKKLEEARHMANVVEKKFNQTLKTSLGTADTVIRNAESKLERQIGEQSDNIKGLLSRLEATRYEVRDSYESNVGAAIEKVVSSLKQKEAEVNSSLNVLAALEQQLQSKSKEIPALTARVENAIPKRKQKVRISHGH